MGVGLGGRADDIWLPTIDYPRQWVYGESAANRGKCQPREESDARSTRAGRPMKPTILVVEDDAVARTFAGRILMPRYEVDFAVDAHEARGKLIGAPIDLLLCDIFLP